VKVKRLLAALLVIAPLALPAAAQVTKGDLAEALAELDELRVETAALAAEYEAAFQRDIELQGDIDQLESIIASRNVEIRDLRNRAQVRAVEMYIDAAGVGLATVFNSASPNEVDTRSEYLGDLGKADQAIFNGLAALAVRLDSEKGRLGVAREDQAASIAALEEVAADLNDRLEAAQGSYDALYDQFLQEERARLAEIERQRRIAEENARKEAEEAARLATSTTTGASTATTTATTTTTAPSDDGGGGTVPTGSRTCPVDGFTSFSDSWGAPRSGGRWHQGVDMLSAKFTAVVAVEAGTIKRMSNSSLGGITVWLRTSARDEFYYAHLDSWAPGLSEGQTVSVGQKIGEVGTTGNAPAHIPHLHWEYHPGGGGAVNPTPLASALCG
jgi:murein DD-endopeptidase MepM/ murein hydrolase activator NlpD